MSSFEAQLSTQKYSHHSVHMYAFVNTIKYEDEKVLLDKYTIFEQNKEVRIVYNWLQHFR